MRKRRERLPDESVERFAGRLLASLDFEPANAQEIILFLRTFAFDEKPLPLSERNG
jgi:hypothetical protein